MGILDNVVNERLSAEQEENKKVLDKLSREELEKRRLEDFALKSRTLVSQALREFPDACLKLGINGLPLLVKKRGMSLLSKPYKCLWGHGLCYTTDDYSLRLFRDLDGTFYMGMEDFKKYKDGKVVSREYRPAAIPTCLNSAHNYYYDPYGKKYRISQENETYVEKISFDDAVSLVCEDLMQKAAELNVYRTPAFPKINAAYEKDDPETAVTELFSRYIQNNASQTERLANTELLLKFYKSL